LARADNPGGFRGAERGRFAFVREDARERFAFVREGLATDRRVVLLFERRRAVLWAERVFPRAPLLRRGARGFLAMTELYIESLGPAGRAGSYSASTL
jgi:hypothetical protein